MKLDALRVRTVRAAVGREGRRLLPLRLFTSWAFQRGWLGAGAPPPRSPRGRCRPTAKRERKRVADGQVDFRLPPTNSADSVITTSFVYFDGIVFILEYFYPEASRNRRGMVFPMEGGR